MSPVSGSISTTSPWELTCNCCFNAFTVSGRSLSTASCTHHGRVKFTLLPESTRTTQSLVVPVSASTALERNRNVPSMSVDNSVPGALSSASKQKGSGAAVAPPGACRAACPYLCPALLAPWPLPPLPPPLLPKRRAAPLLVLLLLPLLPPKRRAAPLLVLLLLPLLPPKRRAAPLLLLLPPPPLPPKRRAAPLLLLPPPPPLLPPLPPPLPPDLSFLC